MTTCTLTIKDDLNCEYEDDGFHKRATNDHVTGSLGGTSLTRDVVNLLSTWLGKDPLCGRRELRVLGQCLYEIAFGGAQSTAAVPMRRAFEKTFDLHKQQESKEPLRLRLVLREDAKELGGYPWEFLNMPNGTLDGSFLAGQDSRLILTRFVPNSNSWASRSEDEEGVPLVILVVVSRPSIPGMDALDVDQFVGQLEKLDQSRFSVTVSQSPTAAELRAVIHRVKPHVIHYIGHGRPGEISIRKSPERIAEDQLAYEDDKARGKRPEKVSEGEWIGSSTAEDLLCTGLDEPTARPRLIFLHACEVASREQTAGSIKGFNSLARSLMRQERVTAVVAMQYSIGVAEAELFARAFYTNISEGRRLDAAVAAARRDFAETPSAGRETWGSRGFGTPVVYLRREEPLVKAPRIAVEVLATAPTILPRLPGKEWCPNPDCDGYVIRGAAVQRCRKCKYQFVVCPVCTTGLVVSTDNFECSNCDYVFDSRSFGVTPAAGPNGSPDSAASATGYQSFGGQAVTASAPAAPLPSQPRVPVGHSSNFSTGEGMS